jgi:hypothetical protein
MARHRLDTHDNPAWVAVRAKKPAPQSRSAAPICPCCGGIATLSAGKYGVKAECCGLWSWGLKPLVDRDTHVARIKAHEAFDQIWKSGAMHRSDAYARLAEAMGMTKDECHIALMTAEQARQVRALVVSGWLLEKANA